MKRKMNHPIKDLLKSSKSVIRVANVHLTVNSLTDTYNIRCLVPYVSENNANHGGECNMRILRSVEKTNKNKFFTHDSKL